MGAGGIQENSTQMKDKETLDIILKYKIKVVS